MVKRIVTIVVFAHLASSFSSLAQEARLKFIGVEAGALSLTPKHEVEHDFIRGKFQTYTNDYYYGGGYDYVFKDFSKFYAGVNVEIWSKDSWFGLTTGVRFTHLSSSFYRSGNDEFFYVLLNQQGTTTEYARVKEFSQESNYLGIPLALKCQFMRFKKFRAYGKATLDLGFRLNSNSDVDFINQAMEPNKDAIIRRFGDISNVSSSFSWSSGISYGSVDKVNVSLDVIMISAMLIQKSSSLVEPSIGAGAQINVQVPF